MSLSVSATATATCPICNAVVPQSTLQRHANQCLDAQSHPDDIPSPPLSVPSSPSQPQRPSPRPSSSTSPSSSVSVVPSLPHTQLRTPASASSDSLHSWLVSLGLSKYTACLLRADYRTLNDLRNRPPTDAALRDQCAVSALGARRKLLSALSALTPVPPLPNSNLLSSLSASTAGASGTGQYHEGDTNSRESTKLEADVETNPKPKRKIWAIFEPGYRASASSPPKRPRPRPQVGAVHNEQPSRDDNNSRNNNWQPPGRNFGVSSRSKDQKGGSKKIRHFFSHRVAGTSFTVDSFKAAMSDPGCTTFFLTHFHSDHYGGLSKKRFPAGARVVCTAVTSRLVQAQLHIPASMIRVLPVGKKVDFVDAGRLGVALGIGIRNAKTTPTSIFPAGSAAPIKSGNAGASVWAYDANHCPGAVVLLFHIWSTGRYILHCGDCRFDPAVFQRHTKLVDVIRSGHLDILHLDTTYCDPRYSFPLQRAVLDDVVMLARREDVRTRKRCLFFFGTYSIGKEKVFLAVAQGLDLHIYASKRKRSILDALDLGEAYTERIVDNPQQARVHVVSMFDLRPGMITKYAQRNGLNTHFVGRGLAVLFRPTGWSFDGSKDPPKAACRSADQALVYSVPYSEHSSFDELRQFVAWTKPARLIPTVGGNSKEKADAIRAALGHVDCPMRAIGMMNRTEPVSAGQLSK